MVTFELTILSASSNHLLGVVSMVLIIFYSVVKFEAPSIFKYMMILSILHFKLQIVRDLLIKL
jgi:hypothetical protein